MNTVTTKKPKQEKNKTIAPLEPSERVKEMFNDSRPFEKLISDFLKSQESSSDVERFISAVGSLKAHFSASFCYKDVLFFSRPRELDNAATERLWETFVKIAIKQKVLSKTFSILYDEFIYTWEIP